MFNSKFGFLSNHFSFKYFDLKSNNDFYKDAKKILPASCENTKFAICFVENETNAVLQVYGYTSEKKSFDISFQHYLNQLPNLELNNVAFLFAMTNTEDLPLLDNAFEIPKNYPSNFCKSFLKETNGQVVYTYQLMQLLSFCLPTEENSHSQINDYRRQYNMRQASFYERLKTLYLPDGYSLYKLLEDYTPYYRTTGDFGFLTTPTHKMAYSFIEVARKYIK